MTSLNEKHTVSICSQETINFVITILGDRLQSSLQNIIVNNDVEKGDTVDVSNAI